MHVGWNGGWTHCDLRALVLDDAFQLLHHRLLLLLSLANEFLQDKRVLVAEGIQLRARLTVLQLPARCPSASKGSVRT